MLGKWLLIIAALSTQAVGEETCQVLTLQKIGKTTTYLRDLEVTGIDLIKNEKRNLPGGAEVPVGIIEAGLELDAVPKARLAPRIKTNQKLKGRTIGQEPIHGTEVASLIVRPDVGVGGPGKIVAIVDADKKKEVFKAGWTPADKEFYEDLYQGELYRFGRDFSEAIALLNEAHPKIVNFSGEMGSFKKTEEQFRNTDFILVTSSGNDPSSYPVTAVKSRVKAIVVGFYRVDGTRGGNSGPSVDLLAPAETPSVSSAKGQDGNGPSFGLSSGAAALVTSSLVPVLSLLPNIDVENAERLLKLTATPINGQADGLGMLNSYRLLRVAERISNRLAELKLAGSPKDITALLNKEGQALLDFHEEAKTAFEQASQLRGSSDCANLAQRGLLLRKAFLLDPSSLYQKDVVEFYNTLPKANGSLDEIDLEALSKRTAKLFSGLGVAPASKGSQEDNSAPSKSVQ